MSDVLALAGVSVVRGDTTILDDVSWDVEEGQRYTAADVARAMTVPSTSSSSTPSSSASAPVGTRVSMSARDSRRSSISESGAPVSVSSTRRARNSSRVKP